MKEVFEVKRSKLYYEENGCQCDDIADMLSFRGIATGYGFNGTCSEDVIIGFYDYKTDGYYWFYEDFDELYLNKVEKLNTCGASLDEFEIAMNHSIEDGLTFKLTQIAHDYSLVFGRNDMQGTTYQNERSSNLTISLLDKKHNPCYNRCTKRKGIKK